ncbi:hypothetical protein Taro_034355 [Colocasia esculenta]|uniref:Uncharacterized protein n=1 Tax=Colocasia esculenta TaxID=4460 RepID=A0A843W3V0_COLES|nr:hypothetical protein [Colocasia esculenta]
MGGGSLRIWLQKDAYIVLGNFHLSTGALRNRTLEFCPGLTLAHQFCIKSMFKDINVIIKNMIYGKPNSGQEGESGRTSQVKPRTYHDVRDALMLLLKLTYPRKGGMSFTSCWGHVEEFLVAGEQEIEHTEPFFFPFASTSTCANRPTRVDQSPDDAIDGPGIASALAAVTTLNVSAQGKVTMKFKRRSKSRMGMRLSDERSNT